jgi:hypothetical protein
LAPTWGIIARPRIKRLKATKTITANAEKQKKKESQSLRKHWKYDEAAQSKLTEGFCNSPQGYNSFG